MKRLEKKHPLAIRWFHWVNFPVLMIMIWSGLLIYWAVDADPDNNNTYHVRIGNWQIVHLFPAPFYTPHIVKNPATLFEKKPDAKPAAGPVNTKGGVPPADADAPDPQAEANAKKYFVPYDLSGRLAEGMSWHFFFMWFFLINGVLYVLYTAFSGEWRHLLPNRHALKEAMQVTLHDLHLSKYHPPRRKFNGAQQIAYTSIIFMGAGSVVTGLAIYKPVQFGWLTALCGGYGAARFLHFWLMMGYCGFFVVHVSQVVRAGWNNFRAMVTGYEITDDGKRVPGYKPVLEE